MLKLPKIEREQNSKCKCQPICKSRRRNWKRELQNTSAELLSEIRPIEECLGRLSKKVFPNSFCPLFGKNKPIKIQERDNIKHLAIGRICEAPIEDLIETPYLKFAEIARRLGAWDAVKACCAFCKCGSCCSCDSRGYNLSEESRDKTCEEMRKFNARVKHDYKVMRIMYNVF